MTPPTTTIPYPKARRSAPKTRTGCGTCRIRRVKCDEAKPICQRCTKFGVGCDGYLPSGQKQKPQVPKRKLLPLAGRPKIPSSTAIQPKSTALQTKLPPSSILSNSLFKNTEEAQYFNLFCNRTGHDIFPTFDSGHTRHRLLESAHSNPSILHAIIALGALDKCAEIAYSFSNLSITSKTANYHHQNALKQYAFAIKHISLEVSLKTQDLRTMLLTSLLILAFESWTGNMDLAVKQVHASIRLIQEWKENYRLQKQVPYIPLSPTPYEVEDDLIQIFCRLAVQHSFFADGHSKELHTILGMEGPTFTRSMPPIFTDVYEAGKYYNGIIRRGVYLITTHSAYLGPAQNSSSNLSTEDSEFWKWALKEQEEIQGDVWRFNKAFAPVLERVEKGEGAEKERHYALFIQMSLAVGYIGLCTHLSVDEGIHDAYNPVYRKVVDLAKLVLKEEVDSGDAGEECGSGGRRKKNFCFDTRVIVPLWVVGLKCRESRIRREAIEVLLGSQRREGIWDSVFAGKVLEWAMGVEERFMFDGKVPVWARLEGVKWSVAELGAKRAELFCLQREKEGGDMVRRTKVITW